MLIGNVTLWSGVPGAALLPGAAVLTEGPLVLWAGPECDLPASRQDRQDGQGRLLTPGLIDCHTHLVHGGHRAGEFEARLNGASYEDIARAGGGILSTVRATRALDLDGLVDTALPRLNRLIAEGVTGVEVKSGYGLDADTELRMLRAARRLGQVCPVAVATSFLGAHAVPPGMTADGYLTEICLPTLRRAAAEGLADAVDGFCEGIAFSPSQISILFDEAHALGLPVRLHADQLSPLGGGSLAARHGALSADHLEHTTTADAAAMAAAGTVAVLLPGAFYTLRDTHLPPVAALRAHQVPMAVATDINPGSSPLNSLLLAMNMACTLFRLTVEEAMAGVTRNAARALGWRDRGMIAPGLRADLCLWDAESPAELAYRIGVNPLHQRIFGGVPC